MMTEGKCSKNKSGWPTLFLHEGRIYCLLHLPEACRRRMWVNCSHSLAQPGRSCCSCGKPNWDIIEPDIARERRRRA